MKKLITAVLLLASVSVFAQGEAKKAKHHGKKAAAAAPAPTATPEAAPAK
jgi:hypothetical protein